VSKCAAGGFVVVESQHHVTVRREITISPVYRTIHLFHDGISGYL
jgi:hypothetical protein